MKSVIVIDTPTRCYDCPLFTSIGYEDGYADEYGFCDDRNILKQKEAQEKIGFDEKPAWCPLRPLPKKEEKPTKGEDDYNDFCIGYTRGWNECLEDILGETE